MITDGSGGMAANTLAGMATSPMFGHAVDILVDGTDPRS